MKAAYLALFAVLCASAVTLTRAEEEFTARYAAAAPADDPAARGVLELEIEDGDDGDDEIKFRAVLYNVADITGVHLHLEGNSSDGLFGGPLLLALTNTTTSPVSSSGDRPLVQIGERKARDLVSNPQRAAVQARLQALGRNENAPETTEQLIALIRANLVYTDVHSVLKVSPVGVTRGRVRRGDVDDIDDTDTDDDDVVAASTPASGDDGD